MRRLRKRGLGKAHEHCLLSATALNLKRMVKLLTPRKLPGVSLHKTPSAIGRSSMLYPMALLSTGPFHSSPRLCKQGKAGPILQNRLLRLRPKPIRAKLSRPTGWGSFCICALRRALFLFTEYSTFLRLPHCLLFPECLMVILHQRQLFFSQSTHH